MDNREQAPATEITPEDLDQRYPSLKRTYRSKLLLYYPPREYFKILYEEQTEFPVFAAIVIPTFKDGLHSMEVVAVSGNQVNKHTNSLAHAEKVVIEEAQQKLESKHLHDCILLSTTEPCAMCGGSIGHTELQGVVYGLSQSEMANQPIIVSGQDKSFRTEPPDYHIEKFLKSRSPQTWVVGGYMKEETGEMLFRLFETQIKRQEQIDKQPVSL